MDCRDICSQPGVLDVYGEPSDIKVFGVTEDSRQVRFGYVFCARPSARLGMPGGETFCALAVNHGAQVIVVSGNVTAQQLGLSPYDLQKVVIIRVDDVARFYAKLVSLFYRRNDLVQAAVTGTNGKTSTANIVSDIWNIAGRVSVSVGTLGVRQNGKALTNTKFTSTTLDAKSIQVVLEELAARHLVTHAVLEASSHALHQRRLDGLDFDIAAFTNLTHEHLDYHHTMEEYGAAKSRLFDDCLRSGATAIVNTGDRFGRALSAKLRRSGVSVVTYSACSSADLELISAAPVQDGQIVRMRGFAREYSYHLPLAGTFQAENSICAIAMAHSSGLPLETCIDAARYVNPVPGRLELVALLSNGAKIFVDFAHTHDGLRNALTSLRSHMDSRRALAVLFGCGGDRDKGKRSMMGTVAAKLADRIYITDDNPRTEPPAAIRRQIIEGAGTSANILEIEGRHLAIEHALRDLRPGDFLLVAGKGHEDYQIVSATDSNETIKVPFHDATVIRNLAAKESN